MKRIWGGVAAVALALSMAAASCSGASSALVSAKCWTPKPGINARAWMEVTNLTNHKITVSEVDAEMRVVALKFRSVVTHPDVTLPAHQNYTYRVREYPPRLIRAEHEYERYIKGQGPPPPSGIPFEYDVPAIDACTISGVTAR